MFWKRNKKPKIKATELSQANFTSEITSKSHALAFFEAPWCGACKILHPILNELANENQENDVLIAVVNTDHERELSQHYHIRSLPTLVVFRGEEIIHQGSGMISKPRLQEMIDNLLNEKIKTKLG